MAQKTAGDSSHLSRVTAITVNQPDRGYRLMHHADGMTSHAAFTYSNADRYRYDLGTKPVSIRFSDSDAHLTFAYRTGGAFKQEPTVLNNCLYDNDL